MKIQNPKTRWTIDAILFSIFILAYFLDLTGLTLHQLLGVFCALFAAYHLLIHWDWVKSVAARLWLKTSVKSRLYFLLNLGVFIGTGIIIGTGLVISSWLNLPLIHYDTWLKIHIMGSLGTLALLAVKVAVHWRWIVLTARKIYTRPVRISAPAGVMNIATNQNQMSRREFLRVALPASAVTIAAAGMAIRGLSQLNYDTSSTSLDFAYAQKLATNSPSSPVATQSAATAASTPATTVPSSVSLPTQVAATQSSSVAACTVLCSRHCSYPGRCGRYIDTNNNNRCDRGECL